MTENERPKTKVVQLDAIRDKRDRQKECKCQMPQYEIDIQADRVTCLKCGAIMEPMKVLLDLADRQRREGKYTGLVKLQKKARNGVKNFFHNLFY